MNTDDNLLNSVIDLIHRQTSIPKREICKESRLLHDLKIFGDEAYVLIDLFIKEFNVEMSSFEFGKYFPYEGFSEKEIIWALCHPFSKKNRLGPGDDYPPITVGKLVTTAAVKKWSE